MRLKVQIFLYFDMGLINVKIFQIPMFQHGTDKCYFWTNLKPILNWVAL